MAQTKKAPAKKPTKKPTDHQPKATEAPKTLSVEVRGKTWIVDKDALDDFELLDDLGAVDAGNTSRLPSALRRLLGPVQWQQAMTNLRDPQTGRVSTVDGVEFVGELFKALPNS